jgi:hypothetical protein
MRGTTPVTTSTVGLNDVAGDHSAEPISANPHTQFASTDKGVQPAVNTRKRQAHGQMNASELDDPDAAVMRVLYHGHAAALLRYALRLTGVRARAEDGVQETLLRAWQHPEIADDSERSPGRGCSPSRAT